MKPKSILLVEDNPSDIDLAKRAFERAGILNPIAVVEDGQEALDYLLGKNETGAWLYPLPSVVLLDLKLPLIDGLEVLAQIRK